MSEDGYMKQKCYEALLALVGDEDIYKRLSYASIYLAHLRAHGWPIQYDAKLSSTHDKLVKVHAAIEGGSHEMPLSRSDAEKLAQSVLGLFVDVMGGL